MISTRSIDKKSAVAIDGPLWLMPAERPDKNKMSREQAPRSRMDIWETPPIVLPILKKVSEIQNQRVKKRT